MTNALQFTKMHGLGNDYVYVDCFREPLNDVDRPALSRAISDRHRGVGSDGLILICPPDAGVPADCRMEMYNADGSRGEMCGNGIRCVAKYAIEHGLIMNAESTSPNLLRAELNQSLSFMGEALGLRDVTSRDIRVQTDRGVLALTVFSSDGFVTSVRVDMGPPILKPAEIPVGTSGDRCVNQPIQVGEQKLTMTCVSMGNPHAVFFVDRLEGVELARLGPLVERHRLFPNRVNAHYVSVQSRREATMKTWERGSGATQACGTGACAVLVAGVLEGRLDRSATLHLPGGDLAIEWPEGGSVFMTGSAVEVFSGVWRFEQGEIAY